MVTNLQRYRCLHLALINIKLVNANYFEMVDALGFEVVDNLKSVLCDVIEDSIIDPSMYLEDWIERFDDLMRLNDEFV